MKKFRACVFLDFVFLITMSENGWILNPAGPKTPFYRPDSYLYVKDGNSAKGNDNVFSCKNARKILNIF